MHEKLIASIDERVKLDPKDIDLIKIFFISKKLRKRQYLLNAGEVCHHLTFVAKGLLRSFSVDDSGKEHSMQFAREDGWISDMGSFITEEPATYNIEVLEDCELLMLRKEGMNQLIDRVPKFDRYFRILMQNHIVALQRRILVFQTLSAEENYRKFMQLHPDLLMRAPQQHIASYLGITPETLSRVRKLVAYNK